MRFAVCHSDIEPDFVFLNRNTYQHFLCNLASYAFVQIESCQLFLAINHLNVIFLHQAEIKLTHLKIADNLIPQKINNFVDKSSRKQK